LIAYGKEKNELLKQNRGIGFEEIISAINSGKVLDVYDHPIKRTILDKRSMLLKPWIMFILFHLFVVMKGYF